MGAYAPTPASRADALAARTGYILLQRDVASPGAAAAVAFGGRAWAPALKMEALDGSGCAQSSSRCSASAPRGGAPGGSRKAGSCGATLRACATRVRGARRRSSVRGSRRGARRARAGDVPGDGGSVVRVTTADGAHTDARTVVIAAGLLRRAGGAVRRPRPARRNRNRRVFVGLARARGGGAEVELGGCRGPVAEPVRAARRRRRVHLAPRDRRRKAPTPKAKPEPARFRGRWARATEKRTGSGSGRRCRTRCL